MRCATCHQDYDDSYDGCPYCAAARHSTADSLVQDGPAPRRGHGVLILLVVLLLAAAAAFGYYGRLSQAYRFTESCPPEAKIEDISRIAGDVARTTTTSGEIRYVTYSFSDVSCATCAFVAEYHTRTRKVLKTVQVTKYRKEWQETGWNYWLGMPEWGWVTVPYTSTELQNVEEQYEEQVWKLQSARSGLDLDRIRQSLGLE